MNFAINCKEKRTINWVVLKYNHKDASFSLMEKLSGKPVTSLIKELHHFNK